MEKEFIKYTEALALKELGFDNTSCFGVYYGEGEDIEFAIDVRETQYYTQKGYKNGILRPTYSQAFRWFREKHNLLGSIDYSNRLKWYYVIREVITSNTFHNHSTSNKEDFNTYEEAELACLKKLIEIVKEKL